MVFDAIIVAAGSGARAGGPKQWRMLGGKPVARWSAEAFLAADARRIVVVVPPGDNTPQDVFSGLERVTLAQGGGTRAQSVANGLRALGDDAAEIVLVHDAARPLLTAVHVAGLLGAMGDADGAILTLPLADSLKRGADVITSTESRDGLWRAQTPQAFRTDVLRRAYAAWPAEQTPTDDAEVVERIGGRVRIVPGDPRLMKLTYPEDFAMAEALIGRTTRVGQGYDAHRFGPGDHVTLCGVKIAHDQGLVGHSDADAGLHAITDAVLGALGAGDIGQHFPPSDPQWKGAASDLFLAHAAHLVSARGGRIVHIDVTLVCEAPRVGPHRDAMRGRVAEILALPLDAVSVKATTTEGMGFTGRKEGLTASAIATVELLA
ncbi:MAG TPA: bifunctional 2-C-methyl-D-erythritol 4-phosphate cytidylyltransferase/2-C-methyl-D-erythritol 2,4-cyclodiphosphate synthase [Caulobacteraceae bacterium]|jgi:2-C-methyl-D-erythritol 4-phosphate cytidylyltransferase/2-C-methyl-D-erythritol 2,4-cyclodiphosphate synthase|nr:bifunctional 2-C-methyl-D-erythritol 4-phosphate cytidylyltransferase/2-C-methyl-D-erythritol 2,4-cyclodiphosphate synthase [Caulobacteraceae bacterium]